MRGALVGRARNPEESFLVMSRQDHTLQAILQMGWLLPLPWPSPRTCWKEWGLGSQGVSLPGDTRMVRDRKKRECLYAFLFGGWLEGWVSHSWKPFPWQSFEQHPGVGSWRGKLASPSLIKQGLTLCVLLSWHNFFSQLPKHLINFNVLMKSREPTVLKMSNLNQQWNHHLKKKKKLLQWIFTSSALLGQRGCGPLWEWENFIES